LGGATLKLEDMQNFEVQLRKTDNFVYETNYKSVIKNGKHIGTCKMVLDDNKVIGKFELDTDLRETQYIKYNTVIQKNKTWLASIELTDKQTPETIQSIP
jgi:hypothetical protein